VKTAQLSEQAQLAAVDAERQRLARELHDSVTQSLYSLTLLTNSWGTMAKQGRLSQQQVIDSFQQLGEIGQQGLKEMRLLIHQLRPPILEEVGLVGAL
jgi:signal transduction histidine kinase